MIDRFLQDLVKVLGIGAGFASIPLLVSLAELQPPWPPAIGPVSSALVLLTSLFAWEWTRSTRRVRRRRWIVAATMLTIFGLFAYLLLYSLFVEPMPGSDVRLVRGYQCTADARLVYGQACPDLPAEALRDAEWAPLNLWTRTSVTVVRVSLTASWLVFIAGLIAAVGSVVAGRRVSSKKA